MARITSTITPTPKALGRLPDLSPEEGSLEGRRVKVETKAKAGRFAFIRRIFLRIREWLGNLFTKGSFKATKLTPDAATPLLQSAGRTERIAAYYRAQPQTQYQLSAARIACFEDVYGFDRGAVKKVVQNLFKTLSREIQDLQPITGRRVLDMYSAIIDAISSAADNGATGLAFEAPNIFELPQLDDLTPRPLLDLHQKITETIELVQIIKSLCPAPDLPTTMHEAVALFKTNPSMYEGLSRSFAQARANVRYTDRRADVNQVIENRKETQRVAQIEEANRAAKAHAEQIAWERMKANQLDFATRARTTYTPLPAPVPPPATTPLSEPAYSPRIDTPKYSPRGYETIASIRARGGDIDEELPIGEQLKQFKEMGLAPERRLTHEERRGY